MNGNTTQLPFNPWALKIFFWIAANRIKKDCQMKATALWLYGLNLVLRVAIPMTLAPGRIEWSFRLSAAVWPFSLAIEWRYVCDTSGQYHCSDECFWSRSWQRRRGMQGAGRRSISGCFRSWASKTFLACGADFAENVHLKYIQKTTTTKKIYCHLSWIHF